MPASNQLVTWNDIAALVAANQMVWSGSAQSGTYCITWSQFTSNVYTDGTNPASYAPNQCPTYSDVVARAITIMPPTGLTAGPYGSSGRANWVAPTSGLTPTSYTVKWYQNSTLIQTATGVIGLTHTSNPAYSSGDFVNVFVYSVNGALTSSPATTDFTF